MNDKLAEWFLATLRETPGEMISKKTPVGQLELKTDNLTEQPNNPTNSAKHFIIENRKQQQNRRTSRRERRGKPRGRA